MPRTTLHPGEREVSIVRAACEEIEATGICGVTLSAIAKRAGVSRQWLYGFFPDLESIQMAVFRLAQGAFIYHENDPPPRPVVVNDDLKRQSSKWIQMPVACAQVGLYGTFLLSSSVASTPRLHALMTTVVEQIWITPLEGIGVPRSRAWAAATAVSCTAYAERIAVHQGRTTATDAQEHMIRTIDAMIPTDWVLK